MIDKKARFYGPYGMGDPWTNVMCYWIVDYDRRQTFSVTYDGDDDSMPLAIEYLSRHVDNLGSDVHAIEVNPDGELVSVSSKPEDDTAMYIRYPSLRYLQRRSMQSPNTEKSITRKPTMQKLRMRTILRAELCELDRLAAEVDLVSYRGQKIVFKYCFWPDRMRYLWLELNVWARLPPHPNIAPFHRIVVEKLDGQEYVVGFTSRYIAGGTLEDLGGRVFKLKWLKQLTRVVDDLNYEFGIQHEDIALRNLLVNHATDMIMLFDFNVARSLSAPEGFNKADEHRNDVKFVVFALYELITRDRQYNTAEALYYTDMHAVLDVDWVKHPDVRLDKPVASYRAVLDAWLLRREERPNEVITDTSKYINWPELTERPWRSGSQSSGKGADEDEDDDLTGEWERISGDAARAKNIQLVRWERPAQEKIKEGTRVLADGTVIDRTKRRKIH